VSLLHPTTGELYDRAVILSLKIQHGEETGKDIKHFRDELAEISAAICERGTKIAPVVRDELIEVHGGIWRLIETSPPELLRLNARRVAIREQIDRATGEYRGPEKV
jgi:hypothetical protein